MGYACCQLAKRGHFLLLDELSLCSLQFMVRFFNFFCLCNFFCMAALSFCPHDARLLKTVYNNSKHYEQQCIKTVRPPGTPPRRINSDSYVFLSPNTVTACSLNTKHVMTGRYIVIICHTV